MPTLKVKALNSEKTQLTRVGVSAPTQWLVNNVNLKDKTILHFGEGKAFKDTILLRFHGNVWAYDPNSPIVNKRDSLVLDQHYDVGIANYVFNTLEMEERAVAFRQFRQCCDVCYITLRTDQINGIAYQDGVVTKRNTFQKRYTAESAVEEFGGKVVHKASHYVLLEV